MGLRLIECRDGVIEAVYREGLSGRNANFPRQAGV